MDKLEKKIVLLYYSYMQLEGEITHITYHNAANGFTIATLQHNKERTTIVGKFFSATCGQLVRVQGEFVANKSFGQQFEFTTIETLIPTSTNGIQKFLGSGLIKGVGMITAGHIVKRFGTKTLEVIEFQPLELAEIRGISIKKAHEIHQSFMQHRHVQKVVVFLGEYGISVNLAMKIYEIFKNDTIKQIQENPYCLIEAVNGIGFLTADKIAEKFGIDKRSTFRLRAGVVHTLQTACEKNGHTYLPQKTLFQSAQKLLGISDDDCAQFDGIIKSLAFDGVVESKMIEGEAIVAPENLFRHEKKLAEKLALMNLAQPLEPKILTESIQHFEKVNHISFHPEQANAIQTAISNGVSVITGGPGTGKTTIIKCILEILDQENHTTLCLAPTGRAAKRMSDSTGRPASTIHRALAMDFENHKFLYNETNPLACSAVIIDEFSMVDASLAHYLFRALPPDCKIIIVGDKDQLPSVGAGNVLADIIKSGVIKCAFLTQIFRQDEGSLIITNAHLINAGQMPLLDNKSNDFFFETKVNLEDNLATIVGLTSHRLPKFLGVAAKNVQVLAPMKSGLCGTINLNAQLQKTLNPPAFSKPEIVFGSSIFRLGDKIMQTTNNYNMEFTQYHPDNRTTFGKGVFNGDMGFITQVNKDAGEVEVTFEGNKVCTFSRQDLSQLSLAYAITIHKSQGSEFDAVVIPAIGGPSIIFNRNLIYTAITRAKKLVVLVGEKRHLRTMINNKFMLKRNTLLEYFLRTSNKKASALFENE